MMIFNALFSAWAALAAPEQPVEELADEVTAADDVSVDDVEFTDEVDPSENDLWECYDDDDYHARGYCLALCERGHRYRRVTDRIRIRGNRDFCERRARRHCRGRGGLEDVCFGERD
ncbi:hypothetical protein [Nannocystis punicea]|uniref:Secreted protein n=1 Tax=Nannocystis punicea TaxID=2995304 RepID=A0ABY7GZU1_9BACT|nr:hypothetical protein [Nannocystis poenicansa]WAS92448.1 hypothetical protein O0S08_40230 [Nannocystis poenicansa]